MSTQSNERSKGRSQFGLRHLLLLTVLVALAVVGWQKFFYVHPAHKNPSYEKAPYVRSGSARLGDGSLSITSVSRNDRNGKLFVEDGSGSQLKANPGNAVGRIGAGANWGGGEYLDFETVDAPHEEITSVKINMPSP